MISLFKNNIVRTCVIVRCYELQSHGCWLSEFCRSMRLEGIPVPRQPCPKHLLKYVEGGMESTKLANKMDINNKENECSPSPRLCLLL